MDYIDMIKTFMKILWEETLSKEILSQASLVSKLNADWEKVSEWVITLK